MKAILCILLVLPAAAFSEPPDPPATVRVAVFDFQTDGSVEGKFGIKNTGETVANLLTIDLSGLAPIAGIDRRALGQRAGDRKVDPGSPIAPDDARRVGRALGATTLVDGRIFKANADFIITARVVSSGTGQTLGTMVKGDPSGPIPDMVSELSMQIGRIALALQGAEPVSWKPAAIIGSHKAGSFLVHDEVACVMDVDGRLIPDETAHWSQEQPLLPGLHEIFVRYYDGTSTAGHSFVLDAKPGASYEVRYDRQPDMNPSLWIQDRDSRRPVTAMVKATLGQPPPSLNGYYGWGPSLNEWGPFGVWSEQTGNPDFVRPSTPRTK